MPEIKRVFTSGRMNKDLDERLVPNGEYRDALNIQLATSEGSNVGAIQNILGNVKVSDINTKLTAAGVLAGTKRQVLGVAKDQTTSKIYFFLHCEADGSTGQSTDMIVEYDQITNNVSPVIVQGGGGVLDFETNNYITGINILDGFLYYTDNKKEPKQIEIEKFKRRANTSNPFTSDTTGLTEEEITVIKKSPWQPPNMKLHSTLRGGKKTIVYNNLPAKPFAVASQVSPGSNSLQPGDTFTFTLSQRPDFNKNDILKLTGDSGDVVIRIRLTSGPTFTTNGLTNFDAIIISMADNYLARQDSFGQFVVTLEAQDPLFELKFPRFAYRWKYSNNQMSSISPFTDVAFLPDQDNGFDYDPVKSHNKSMTNTVQKITLSKFVTPPDDVTDIQILYKESNSTNVYIIAKLKTEETEVDIVSEQIQGLLESNQLLRTYDNVPLKAKSQDIVGNRLVYGNYTQNFDVTKPVVIDTTIMSKNIDEIKPTKSIKSQRKYQIGVVYSDKYCRKTPVFTNDAKKLADQVESSEVTMPIWHCDNSNQIQVKINSSLPQGGSHASGFEKYFQYYIKENSNEYYNLALDSWYYDKEEYIWLAFQSAERNKIETGDYLILKKLHGEDASVIQGDLDIESIKYKIVDIKNTAPDFVTTEHKLIAETSTLFVNDESYSFVPKNDRKIFRMNGFDVNDNTRVTRGSLSDISTGTQTDLYVKFSKVINKSEVESKEYKIKSVSITDASSDGDLTTTSDRYEFVLEESFGTDVDFIPDVPSSLIKVKFFKDIEKDAADFDSKFFVKIEKNKNLEFASEVTLSEKNFTQLVQTRLVLIDDNDHALGRSSWVSRNEKFALDIGKYYDVAGGTPALTIKDIPDYTSLKGQREVYLRFFGSPIFQPTDDDDGKLLHDTLRSTKTLYLKFNDHNDSTDDDSEAIYKIEKVETEEVYNYASWDSRAHRQKWASNRGFRYKITLNKPITWDPITDGGVTVNDATGNKITTIGNRWSNNKLSIAILEEEIVNTGEKEKNPAIFETEPKAQEVDLNIWHEASPAYPVTGINDYINVGDIVTGFNTAPGSQITVTEVGTISGGGGNVKLSSNSLSSSAGKILTFTNPDTGAAVTQEVQSVSNIGSGKLTMKTDNHGRAQTLSWFNCFAFGNGVESNRIRDDFNAVTIDKGPKVSATLSEPYSEERRNNGLIYSGIYNSNSSVNELNQFNTALKITKDLNPTYGSIQKIYTRNTDLIAFCEDKVLKILASKDALFNADGNVNLIATENVLGQAIPFAGDYGISKNPESFASYGYRVYFADKKRGAVLRLSMDGLTNIAEVGMRDYFIDNLKEASSVVGSYDSGSNNYNITLNNDTVSYTELTRGWVSRKSFIPDVGCSLNNIYYTFKDADMWSHTNETRNTFYAGAAAKSSVNLIFNDAPSSIKNFKTINYEGSKDWKAIEITSDQQSGKVTHFKDKENKFFNYIKGTSTKSVTLNFVDNNNSNIVGGVNAVIKKNVGATVNDVVTITIRPQDGHQVASSISGFTYQGTDTKVTSVTNITATEVDEASQFAQAITFKVNLSGFTMPSSDVVINLPFNTTGAIEVAKFTYSNRVINDLSNATASLSSGLSTFGTYNSTVTVATQVITPASNFTLTKAPKLDLSAVKNPGSYTHTTTGPDSNGAYTIVVQYTYPSENVAGDVLYFRAHATNSITESTNKVYGAEITANGVEDMSNLSSSGETRIVRVYGDAGAQFTINAYNNATSSTSLIGGVTTKTIGSDGFIDVNVTFPAIGTTARVYSVKLQEVNSGDFTDTFDAEETGGDGIVIFTLNQYVDAAITFGISNNPIGLTVINSTPHFSSYSITGAANEELDAPDTVDLLFKVTSSQNISLDQYYPYYQHFSRVSNTTATTTGGSVTNTTFTIASANANIFPGMVVTGTGISGYVFVESISGTTLVLSESVTLNNATLTFSGVDTTKQQIVISGGSIVKFGRSTVTIDNSGGTKSAIFSMQALVVKYGTTNATTNLDLAAVFNISSGTPSAVIVTASASLASGNKISSVTLDSSPTVAVGTAAGTIITGTGTLVGNFSGSTSSQVDISYDTLVGFNDSTGSSTTPTPAFGGTGSSSQSADFNWSMRLTSEVTSSSILAFKLHATDTPE